MTESKRERIENAISFRKVLQAALIKFSKTTGIALQRLRRDAAFEVFTRRVAASGFFVLKGAHALELRSLELDELGRIARSTKDLDFLARVKIPDEIMSSENTKDRIGKFLIRTLRELSQPPIDSNDRFEFVLNGIVKEIDAQGPSACGFRVEVECRLGQENWEKFLIDIVFGDALVTEIDEIKTGRLIAMAGIAPGNIQVISTAQHFAEKLHAYTFPRPEGENTRAKDLIDMTTLVRRHSLSPAACARAIHIVFAHRATHPIPAKLSPPPESWKTRWPALAADASLQESLEEAFQTVTLFVEKCLSLDTQHKEMK